MSRLHYFQRFSQKENVDTNNTLLLLSRIQATDPRLLRAVLAELFVDSIDSDVLQVGVQFSQQTSDGVGSIPDGMLFQSSFRIILETKRAPRFPPEQLQSHVSHFGNETTKVLLLLAPERVDQSVPGAPERGIAVVSRTFEDIISACRTAGVAENLALGEVLDDFDSYCFDGNLMSGNADRMLALGTGETIDENLDLRLYYKRVSESLRKHLYLGLYNNKVIVAVGKVDKSVFAELIDGRLVVRENDVALTPDEEERIIAAIKLAPSHGYDTATDHRFLLVNRFVRTDFRKASPGEMMGKRYFSLKRELDLPPGDALPDIDTIAQKLKGRTWE